MSARPFIVAFSAAVIVFVLLRWFMVVTANAHEAPLGWTYPYLCCSDRDCKQAADGAVRETSEGYRIVSTGEIVPYRDRRIKDSPDGLFHTCQQAGNFDAGRILCLFIPPRAF